MAQANGNVKSALDYLDPHLSEFQDQLVGLSRIPASPPSRRPHRLCAARPRPRPR